jgi:hypothetical protein
MTGEIVFDSNRIIMAKKTPVVQTNNIITYHGPGNLTINNNTFHLFHMPPQRIRVLLTVVSIPFCNPDKGDQNILIKGNDLTSPETDKEIYLHLVVVSGFLSH